MRAHRAGDPVAPAAIVVCWNREDGRAYKAVVDITGERVAEWEHPPASSRT